MVQKIFAIYDRKATVYRYPNFVRNVGTALRSFQTAVTDEGTEISRFPGDFELWEMGEWDDETGALTSLSKPNFVVSALALLEESKVVINEKA